MSIEDNYSYLVSEFNEKLKALDGKTLGTQVQGNEFTVAVDDEWITTTTKSSGEPLRVRRVNSLVALRILVEKGSLTKKEMENLRGLGSNKAIKLFAIIDYLNLSGVTAKSNPMRLIYKASL